MTAFWKTVWRTIWSNKGRFLANFVICLLSVALSSGLAALPDSFEQSFVSAYTNNPPDLIVKSTSSEGLSEEQIQAVGGLDGVDETFPFMSFDFQSGESYYRLYIVSFSDMDIGYPELTSGSIPTSWDQVIAFGNDLNPSPYAVGSTITDIDFYSTFKQAIPDSLEWMFQFPESFEVTGIASNSLYRSASRDVAYLESDETKYIDGVFYINADSPQWDGILTKNLLVNTDLYVRAKGDHAYFTDGYKQDMDDLSQRVKTAVGDGCEVLTMEENTSYALFKYYNDKVEKISYVLPWFFVVICALINLITMQRLMKDERSEIGCYSSLGFHKRQIAFKFLFFAFLSSAFGCLFGYFLGTPLIPLLIFPAYNKTFVMGDFSSTFMNGFGIGVAIGVVVVSLGVTTYIALSYLRESPADLLKDKSPKPGKKILLERIKPVWKMLSFSWKSSMRNIFRQKKNLILTALSVIGGTVIIMLGFALNDASAALEGDELFGDVASSMGQISSFIILFAIAMAITVIYSLANMNIEDRKREIATLKVLGYHDIECSLYTFREIIFIVVLASALGVGVGTGVVYWMFSFLGFGTIGDVEWYSYLASPILIIVSTIVVSLLLFPNIRRIDMNSSLKSVE